MTKPEPSIDEVFRAVDAPYTLGKRYRNVPASVIRGVLAAKLPEPNHRFLGLALAGIRGDAKLVAMWQRAVQALVDTNLTYAWGSKPRRDRIQKLARDPEMLAAIQGTVANSEHVRLDFLAVLVADGSAESFDALVPHLDPALVHRDVRLDRLTRLRRHAARTPALDAMFAEIDEVLEQRRTTSPALDLAMTIGLGTCDELWFQASLTTTRSTQPRFSADIRVDSRKATWFHVSLHRIDGLDYTGTTSFDAAATQHDELELGRCSAAELPVWLAKIARQLRLQWELTWMRSGHRGANRARIGAWLLAQPG